MRIGEAIAVSWDDIDIEAEQVKIDHKIIRVTGKGLLRVPRPKSEAGHRTLPLPLFAVRMPKRRSQSRGSPTAVQPKHWISQLETSHDVLHG